MATDHLPPCYHADEDYIDMEVSSSSNFFFDSTNSPPQTREFEFQMSLNSHEKESTTSPADELFYKGKLLPLHLPPRLQMVQKLLQNSTTTTTTFDNTKETLGDDQFYSIAFITTSTTSSTNTSTPLESCNISPSESRRVSSEINPDEYFFEWSTELTDFIGDRPKKFISWSKKLKMIKQSSLRQKLKASRAYLKSLFNKSACSDESSAKEAQHWLMSLTALKKRRLRMVLIATGDLFQEQSNDILQQRAHLHLHRVLLRLHHHSHLIRMVLMSHSSSRGAAALIRRLIVQLREQLLIVNSLNSFLAQENW